MYAMIIPVVIALLLNGCSDSDPTAPYITLTPSVTEIVLYEGDYVYFTVRTSTQGSQVHCSLGGDVYCLAYFNVYIDPYTSTFGVVGRKVGTSYIYGHVYSTWDSDTIRIPITVKPRKIASIDLTMERSSGHDGIFYELYAVVRDSAGTRGGVRDVTWEVDPPNRVVITPAAIDCYAEPSAIGSVRMGTGSGKAKVTAVCDGIRSNEIVIDLP